MKINLIVKKGKLQSHAIAENVEVFVLHGLVLIFVLLIRIDWVGICHVRENKSLQNSTPVEAFIERTVSVHFGPVFLFEEDQNLAYSRLGKAEQSYFCL